MTTTDIDRMHAVRFHEYGPPGVLRVEQVPRPTAGQGEVLVRIRAAGVNPGDWQMRSGIAAQRFGLQLPLPFTPGYDLSGVVAEVGPGAERFKVGDAVYGMTANAGGYAEYAAVPESHLTAKPATLDDIRAAAVPMSAFTAWNALADQANVQPGQTVLINGASGGVGHFAVQFAKRLGAQVIGVASGRNQRFLQELGADRTIDYTRTVLHEAARQVDTVIDTVGGEHTDSLIRTLRRGGALVPIGYGRYSPELAAEAGVTVHELRMMQIDSSALARIGEQIDAGVLKVVVDAVFPLEAASEAHELSESRRARGKIVLNVDP